MSPSRNVTPSRLGASPRRKPKPRRAALRAELVAAFEQLDRRVAGAMLTILEILADIDPRRARRLLEAVGTLIALAPRRAPRKVGAR
jgi:hypothetical protein